MNAKQEATRTITLTAAFTFLLLLLADYLFWGVTAGWTAGGFALVIFAVFLSLNSSVLERRGGKIGTALALVQALLLIYDADGLSAGLFLAAILSLAVMSRGIVFSDALAFARPVFSLFARAPLRLFKDAGGINRGASYNRYKNGPSVFLRRWTLPLLLGAVFLILFVYANPVMDGWLTTLDWEAFIPDLGIVRTLFWFFVAALIWSILRPRLWMRDIAPPKAGVKKPSSLDWLFTPESVLRSLILFNVLFAFQTVMDLFYLWGGAALPDGLSHAAYAHRGAYPLIVTALLAAAFVLIALRPGLDHPHTKNLMRGLLYLWVAQNIMLVISSILRTELYIEEYSLTYLRFAAVIWMGLVALGLCLIVARMLLEKSNRWLINTNALALLVTLYICSALDIGGLIAQYNVRHNREISGQGEYLDYNYLARLGPSAFPATDWLLAQKNGRIDQARLGYVRDKLRVDLNRQMCSWHGWTFRAWRQARMQAAQE